MPVFGLPDYIRPEGPISALHPGVRVPEVRAGVRGQHTVPERRTQRDWALCYQRGTVHVWRSSLVVPVPMNCGALRHEGVGQVDDQSVALADLDEIKQHMRLVDESMISRVTLHYGRCHHYLLVFLLDCLHWMD